MRYIIGSSKTNDFSFEGVKFGWARVNLHYSFEDADIDYILNAIQFIAEQGYKFLKFYTFEPHSGRWDHEDDMYLNFNHELNLRMLLK